MLHKTLKQQKGFTLLELLLVIAMISIFSVIGVAAFVIYNRNQVVNNAVLEVVTALNTAKSSASSQVKSNITVGGSACDTTSLVGYSVQFVGRDITVEAICGTWSLPIFVPLRGQRKTLPSNVSKTSENTRIMYRTLTGQAYGNPLNQVTIEAFSKKKRVSVNSAGTLTVSDLP